MPGGWGLILSFGVCPFLKGQGFMKGFKKMNINTIIDHFENLKAKKISYSMYGSRTGTDGTGDCSGVLYAALVKAGGPTEKYPPSTETLHSYLTKNGYQLHVENREWVPQKGDIFIWGKKGYSAFAGGHAGIFVDPKNVIHCNFNRNGVSIDDYQIIYLNSGRMYFYCYRLKNSNINNNQNSGGQIKMKKYTLNGPVKLLNKPSSKGGLIAQMRKGDVIKFDNIIVAEGKMWACQPRLNGYGYIEIGAINPHGVIA